MTVPTAKPRSAAQLVAPWLVLCVPAATVAEGFRRSAYLDSVRVPTICMGETLGVKMGDIATTAQCEALLKSRLIEFKDGVFACSTSAETWEPRRVAGVTLFAYNIGLKGYCNSGLRRALDAHRPDACMEMGKWVYAGGKAHIKLQGLVNRRFKYEIPLCEGRDIQP